MGKIKVAMSDDSVTELRVERSVSKSTVEEEETASLRRIPKVVDLAGVDVEMEDEKKDYSAKNSVIAVDIEDGPPTDPPNHLRGRTLVVLMGVARLQPKVQALMCVHDGRRDQDRYPSYLPVDIV